MKIAVLKAGAIGDILQTTPAILALHDAHPESEIDYFCSEEYAHVLCNNPYIKNIRTFSSSKIYGASMRGKMTESLKIIHMLRGYDLCVTFSNDIRWRMLSFFAGIPTRLHTINISHRASDYLRTVSSDTTFTKYHFFPDTSKLPLPKEKYIALACGGGVNTARKSPQKLWDKFPELIETILTSTNYSVALLGSKDDKPVYTYNERICDYTGQTSLSDCYYLIDNAEHFVGNDSGLTHLAACTDTPITALYGPTSPEHTAPYNATCITSPASCAPCEKKGEFDCDNNLCIRMLSLEEVWKKFGRGCINTPPGQYFVNLSRFRRRC